MKKKTKKDKKLLLTSQKVRNLRPVDDDKILGCAVLGIEGGELMAMVEIAMMGGLPYTALRDGIFAHPTLAESFNNLFGSLDAG